MPGDLAVAFTVADVERVVRRLAAEHPERSTDCQYTRGGGAEPRRPLCLFAHALVELGVSIAWLADVDAHEELTAIDSVLVALGLITDRSEAAWLVDVQEHQDVGCTWADAVAAADRDPVPKVPPLPPALPTR